MTYSPRSHLASTTCSQDLTRAAPGGPNPCPLWPPASSATCLTASWGLLAFLLAGQPFPSPVSVDLVARTPTLLTASSSLQRSIPYPWLSDLPRHLGTTGDTPWGMLPIRRKLVVPTYFKNIPKFTFSPDSIPAQCTALEAASFTQWTQAWSCHLP